MSVTVYKKSLKIGHYKHVRMMKHSYNFIIYLNELTRNLCRQFVTTFFRTITDYNYSNNTRISLNFDEELYKIPT